MIQDEDLAQNNTSFSFKDRNIARKTTWYEC